MFCRDIYFFHNKYILAKFLNENNIILLIADELIADELIADERCNNMQENLFGHKR